MTNLVLHERINDLVIDLGRSLLQYVGESWPWSADADAAERGAIEGLVDEQRRTVQSLADLLVRRRHRVESGAYPTDYTSLHYVALDFLLSRLVSQQAQLAEECASLATEAAADAEAGSLLTAAADQARRHLDALRMLLGSWKSRSTLMA